MASIREIAHARYQQLRAYVNQTHVQSSIKGTGAALAIVVIIVNTPSWLLRSGRVSPLLAFNLMIVLCVGVVHLWRRYGGDINVTALRTVLAVLQLTNFIRVEFLSASRRETDSLTSDRRKFNRKLLRLTVFCLLAQHSLVRKDDDMIFSPSILWAQSLIAFIFVLDTYTFGVYVWPTLQTPNDENENPEPGFLSSHGITIAFQAAKALTAANLFFYQYSYASKTYCTVTIGYFLLLEKLLEKPLCSACQYFHMDFFEGLEQHFARALLAFTETTLCFGFVVLVLLENKQYLMILALYTNIYMPAVEFLRDGLTPGVLDWAMIAQFERASREELRNHDDVCAICLCGMSTARRTPCKHLFHGHCLRRALKEKSVCPLCTTPINSL